MRTSAQIESIKSKITDPFSIDKFLKYEEVENLIEIFDSANLNHSESPYKGKIKKNTGPVTLNLSDYYQNPIILDILKRIEHFIGPYEITAAFFFKTDYPHIIHNDDTFELPEEVYKAVTIPLKVYGENILKFPKLCFFEQFYFHGPAKFFKGSENIPTYYNKQIYEYSNIDGLKSEKFHDTDNYFTHLNPRWLEGLSLHSCIDWTPGSAIVFDSVRLHCASDFRSLGIKEKLGLSLFTKKC